MGSDSSWKVFTTSGNQWTDWDIVPSTRDPGAYVIRAAAHLGPFGTWRTGSINSCCSVGSGLASFNSDGGRRNEDSAWVCTHSKFKPYRDYLNPEFESDWAMDWKLYPCADVTCEWPEKSGRL